ncbi:MAG: DHH family phosphoesterase [Candidatus Helarchaeota archaeon]
MEKFVSYIKEKSLKKILILTHQNADPDALCGIYTLYSILNRLFPNLEIVYSSDGLSNLSKQIAAKLNIFITEELENFTPDIIILFDVNNIQHTGMFVNEINLAKKSIVIIDHHAPPPDIEEYSPLSIVDEEAISANEILFHEFDKIGIGFTAKEALSILIGMLYDSKHLLLANSRSFSIIPKLIEYGANYSLAISLLNVPMVRAERIARIKAAQRLELFEINNWLIIFSHVSSYEASACRAILGLGADVAFVIAEHKGEIRISGRSTPEFYEKTNIHLGKDILAKVGPIMNGLGGGHPTAAGCNGKKDANEGKKYIIKILKEKLPKSSNNDED